MKCAVPMLVGVIFLLLLVVWIFGAPKPAPIAPANPKVPQARSTQKNLPILPKGSDVSSLSHEAVLELMESFGEKSPSRNCETDVIVNDGETVVTNGYEEKPGVFIFSTMMPYIATSSKGEPKINVRLQRLHVELGGSIEIGISKTISTDPGHEYGIGYANEWGRADAQSYEIDIHTDIDSASGKIRLKAREYQLYEPGAYAF